MSGSSGFPVVPFEVGDVILVDCPMRKWMWTQYLPLDTQEGPRGADQLIPNIVNQGSICLVLGLENEADQPEEVWYKLLTPEGVLWSNGAGLKKLS